MDHFIERLNIERYHELLRTETDPAKRAILIKLLAEEEAKRAARHKPP